MKKGFAASWALMCFASQFQFAVASTELHVDIKGDDTAEGTLTAPLATLAGARDRIRALRQDANWEPQPINVIIHGGRYRLTETLNLTEADSGTVDSPVRYEAAPGEKVVLSGEYTKERIGTGADFGEYAALPSEVRSKVIVYQLGQGTLPESLVIGRRAVDIEMSPAPVEVFAGGNALPRAGWPDTGWAKIELNADGKSWNLPHEHAEHEFGNAWAHGFFNHNYQDSFEGVTLEHRGESVVGRLTDESIAPKANARYRVENVLCELNAPGEWYVDPANGRILVLPANSDEEVVVSGLETIVSLYDVRYVTFAGIDLQAARSIGIEIVGGLDCAVENCHVHCVGNVGINVYHGFHHVVSGCEISATGSSGIRVEGGNRESLEPADHVCEQNSIHHCGYTYSARRAGISVHGVGVAVKNNELYQLPDWAISLCGNEHDVELNHIHEVCLETSDSGAIYLAHDPTYRGNKIVNNHIHQIGGFDQRDIVAIYLDDFASGTTVVGNVIEKAPRGVVVGGGRDNKIQNNVILECLAGIQIDARGETWARNHVHNEENGFRAFCSAVKHDSQPYAERYPELANILEDEPAVAKGNRIESNVIQCPIGIDVQGIEKGIVAIRNNTNRADAVFVNAPSRDYGVDGSDIAKRLSIEPIPFEEIGARPGRMVATTLQASK